MIFPLKNPKDILIKDVHEIIGKKKKIEPHQNKNNDRLKPYCYKQG